MNFFLISKLMLILGICFLYIPLIVLAIFSFSDSAIINIWGGITLKWYKILFKNKDIINATINSVKIGFISSTCATTIGTIVAYIIVRFKDIRYKNILYSIAIIPLILPDVILGMAFLLVFKYLKNFTQLSILNNGLMHIIIAHITFCSAYVTIIMQTGISSINKDIEEAAMDLGTKPTKIFLYIHLPHIMPSLIASFLLSFTISIDDLIITEFVTNHGCITLSMYIYSLIKNGTTPEINALSTIIIVFITLLISIGGYLLTKINNKIT